VSDQFSTEGVDSSLLSQLARHSNVKYGFEPTRCIEEATTEIKTTTEGWSEAGVGRIVAKSGWSRPSRMPKKPKTISNARLPSHGSSKQNLGTARCDEYGAALARSG
jgi:hypothetical protein